MQSLFEVFYHCLFHLVGGELCLHPAQPVLPRPQRNTWSRAVSGASHQSPDEVGGAPEEEE